MMNPRTLTLALGAIALVTTAMTATAGSWPNIPARKTVQATGDMPMTLRTAKQDAAIGRDALAAGNFEYVGGDADWQLRQHHYTWSASGLAHASDCTLVASTTTPAQPAPDRRVIEPAGSQLPGA